jgi:WD40 repeat protein
MPRLPRFTATSWSTRKEGQRIGVLHGVARRWPPVPVLALALVVVVVAAPASSASSIVYLKGGDIYRASPGGARKLVIVRARSATSFSAVTQDDRGRVYAVEEPSRRWVRFTGTGRRVGRPFNTAGTGLRRHYDRARNLPGFTGPLDVQASNGGAMLTDWGILEQLDHVNPSAIPPAPKYVVQGIVAALVTSSTSDRDLTGTAPTTGLAWPSFLPDGTVIAGVFNNLLKGYGIWYFRPRSNEVRFWFGPTNNTLRLANPEVTRRGDFIAVTTDRDSPTSKDDEIVVGHVPGLPPAVPDRDCTWPNPGGMVSSLTWSPDGTTLAWSDSVGLWTARFAVPPQTGQVCVVSGKHLLARKATSPDWGPAQLAVG